MPRRPLPNRCQFCRRRKKKCDGETPCYACAKANIECIYGLPSGDSATLTVEPGKKKFLKPKPEKPNNPSDTFPRSDAPATRDRETPKTIVNNQSPSKSKGKAEFQADGETNIKEKDADQPIQSIESSEYFTNLPTDDADDFPESPASLRPPRYISAHIDWPRARVLRLIDNILQWDCVALCFIDRDRFKVDLEMGSARYCSPILVDALLALSAVVFRRNVINEATNRESGKTAWDMFGATLANEAIQALHGGTWLPEALPDIQALGVLALYCACHRWRAESRKFSVDFSEAMQKYWIQNDGPNMPISDARRSIAGTYCGAVSMNRIMIQISDYSIQLPLDLQEIQAAQPQSDDTNKYDHLSWTTHLLQLTLVNELFAAETNLCRDGIHLVAAELYQLAEQVFKTCCAPEQARTFSDATATYIKGLEWYQNFFQHSEAYTSREPLILFAHTYYHFCILSLFTPYMMEAALIGTGGSPPGKICEESAQIILKLMKHHDSIAGDTEPVGFMHSFKNASLGFLGIYSKTQLDRD